MKHLAYTFTTTVTFGAPVTDHAFVLRCLPPTMPGQRVEATVETQPAAKLALQRDNFDNVIAVGSLPDEHTSFTYSSAGDAWVDHAAAVCEEAHPLYRYPSPLTRPDKAISALARAAGLASLSHVARSGKAERGSSPLAPLLGADALDGF